MIFETLVGTLTVVGIAHSMLEQALEDGWDGLRVDVIADDVAESLNETGLTDEWTVEDYAALNY